MKKCAKYISLIFMLALTLGCSRQYNFNNPVDPENPDCLVGVSITAGPANDSTVTQTSVLYRWEGTGTASEFQFRMDSADWSAWGVSDSAVYNCLDEGSYNFEVRARNPNNKVQEVPTAARFAVDAVTGPALLARPMLIAVGQSQYFTVEIMAEDVQYLCGAELVINYNPSQLTYAGCTAGSFWTSMGGAVLGPYFSYSPGEVKASLSLVQIPTGVSGSGCIASLSYHANNVPGNAVVGISAQSSLRDADNNRITLNTTRNCTIVVQ